MAEAALGADIYDVLVIGGGASGTSLLYVLAKYTDIKRIILLEKYDRPGQVNSCASNNSQTLHVGDIETNYSLEKVRQVKPAALMVARYAEGLANAERERILFPVSKMVLGVGADEVETLKKRYADIRELFPDVALLDRQGIAEIEPAVVAGRAASVPLAALHTSKGYAVDFERLSQSFVDEAKKARADIVVQYDSRVEMVTKEDDGIYTVGIKGRAPVRARALVVDADSYSLYFAKQLGYGKNFSLIPIAGSFYFSKQLLNGKVYTVQEPLLPFAAVHGDPDVCVSGMTRWGPTARFFPVLESGNLATSLDYLRSSGLGSLRTWTSFFSILLEPIRFKYLVKNMLYELPYVGRRMLVKNVQKIVPNIRARDLKKAEGYGGMRLQRVETKTRELQLGEGKIVGDNVIFNMTPSPGASVCLHNALSDAEKIMEFFHGEFSFRKAIMQKDFGLG